jgi:hypothetical protein
MHYLLANVVGAGVAAVWNFSRTTSSPGVSNDHPR